MQRFLFLLLTAFGLFASFSGLKAQQPHFVPARPHSTGGIVYSEYHHRPYYYRRYYYGPISHPRPHRSH